MWIKSITRSCGVQVRDLNPKPSGVVRVRVCVCLRVQSTHHVKGRWHSRGRGDLVPRSPYTYDDDVFYLFLQKQNLHSTSTCSLSGRARVHAHKQFSDVCL
jgi:hypothetical protein